MKNHDVETIKIELSYHSGAIFKKIVKIRNDTKKYEKNDQKWSQNPSKIHSKTVSKMMSKKVSKNDAQKVENESPKGSQNRHKMSKYFKNIEKIDVKKEVEKTRKNSPSPRSL